MAAAIRDFILPLVLLPPDLLRPPRAGACGVTRPQLLISMSFSAELIVNNKQYSVRRFNWGLQQNTDMVGRPDARVQGGQLQVELDSEIGRAHV